MKARLKKNLKKMPGLVSLNRNIRRLVAGVYESLTISSFHLHSQSFHPDKNSNLIVSLTSFPGRIEQSWIAIESILRQNFRPYKVVLVLSEEEFPTRELPIQIQRQVKRGLEIIWTAHNTRSFKKLLPTRMKYQDATIVTVDDDVLYPQSCLRKLVDAAKVQKGKIIGHRGWCLTASKGVISPYVTWPSAGPETPGDLCFLTGVGAVLYPPHVLPLDLLLNTSLALKLCPYADDIWFWAVARKAGVGCYCLGTRHLHTLKCQSNTPELQNLNRGENMNDVQLAAVMTYFELN